VTARGKGSTSSRDNGNVMEIREIVVNLDRRNAGRSIVNGEAFA